MTGTHLLLLSHAATGVAADHVERLIAAPLPDRHHRREEPELTAADQRRAARRRLRRFR
jgi:hypothetical protein